MNYSALVNEIIDYFKKTSPQKDISSVLESIYQGHSYRLSPSSMKVDRNVLENALIDTMKKVIDVTKSDVRDFRNPTLFDQIRDEMAACLQYSEVSARSRFQDPSFRQGVIAQYLDYYYDHADFYNRSHQTINHISFEEPKKPRPEIERFSHFDLIDHAVEETCTKYHYDKMNRSKVIAALFEGKVNLISGQKNRDQLAKIPVSEILINGLENVIRTESMLRHIEKNDPRTYQMSRHLEEPVKYFMGEIYKINNREDALQYVNKMPSQERELLAMIYAESRGQKELYEYTKDAMVSSLELGVAMNGLYMVSNSSYTNRK